MVVILVTKVTGITNTMLRNEKPFSAVFPLFLDWLDATVSHVNDATDTPHYPGMAIFVACVFKFTAFGMQF